jgi:hypothetical protein
MSTVTNTYRPRRVLAVFAALLLPAATCAVAPSLQELSRRVNLLEQRWQRIDHFAANARLPLMLMDEHDQVVGTVLEYNDMYQYASVGTFQTGGPGSWMPSSGRPGGSNETTPSWSSPEDVAFATIQYTLPGRPPLMLEANREQLLTPKNGTGEYLYFESADCTGRPWALEDYQLASRGSFFSRSWIGSPGSTLYALSPGTPSQGVIRYKSLIYAAGVVGTTQRCIPWNNHYWYAYLLPFEPVADLSQYTPPFRIVDPREFWGF